MSMSVSLYPTDARRRYWAKIVRNGRPLPMPDEVQGAGDIPGPYRGRGDEELLPGDALFEGEANHHRKNRGWTYCLTYVTDGGEVLTFISGFSEQKAALKAQGIASVYLKGAGDWAAMVRIVHGLRMGFKLRDE